MLQPRVHALRRPIGVALACSALLIGAGRPASATHQTVTAVTGSAYGYRAYNVSLFGGAQPDTGPTPTVTLAADASNSPQTATAASGLVHRPSSSPPTRSM